MSKLLILSLFISLSLGCKRRDAVFVVESRQSHELAYPYFANKDRIDRIDRGSEKVALGNNVTQVVDAMGEPDEVNATYHRSIWGKRIGFSFVYVKRRHCKYGSVHDKNESLVRIHFDLEGKVSRVDRADYREQTNRFD